MTHPTKELGSEPWFEAALEIARKELVNEAELNEGEPCWCPLWWWDEQTGPSDGEHTERCDERRALLTSITDALYGCRP